MKTRKFWHRLCQLSLLTCVSSGLVLSVPTEAFARFVAPSKLVEQSRKFSLILDKSPGLNIPASVDYVYSGIVQYPGFRAVVKREIWLRGGANYQMTGFVKELGEGLSCYGFATYGTKGEVLTLDYFHEEDGNQNCPVAGGSFSAKINPQY